MYNVKFSEKKLIYRCLIVLFGKKSYICSVKNNYYGEISSCIDGGRYLSNRLPN